MNCNKCEHCEQCEKSGKQPKINKQNIKFCPDYSKHIDNEVNIYQERIKEQLGINRFGLFESGELFC